MKTMGERIEEHAANINAVLRAAEAWREGIRSEMNAFPSLVRDDERALIEAVDRLKWKW